MAFHSMYDGDDCCTLREGQSLTHLEPKREVVFWAVAPGQEELQHENIDDALEYYLDTTRHKLPHEVDVIGYARMVPNDDGMGSLEFLLEHFDEEMGDPDGDYTKPTPKMIEAAKAFAAVVCAEYVPWMCHEVERRMVNVDEWIRAKHPDWLGGESCER